MRLFVMIVVGYLTFIPQVQAQYCPYTPQRGTYERSVIMNALRQPVQLALRQPVIFVVNTLNVCQGWAALMVTPRRPGGGAIDYRQTRFREAVEEGMFDDGVYALLKRRGNNWQVIKYVIGATDYALPYWVRQYGAPQAIIPR